jgi:hypothetical protein
MTTIANINDHFKLPIFYNKDKMELHKSIIDDLELIESKDPSGSSVLGKIFNGSSVSHDSQDHQDHQENVFSNEIIKQIPTLYTTDLEFLKETQTILAKYNPHNDETFSQSKIYNLWNEIKNDNGFKDKYYYINWSTWDFLNHSDGFLQIMSIYNMSSPIISLLIPVFIAIIPFFMIKMKGLTLSFNEYLNILKILASNHAIGKLFTDFNMVNFNQKIFMIISAAFYIFSIYQNILQCIRFYKNMNIIYKSLDTINNYIDNFLNKVQDFNNQTKIFKTYEAFNNESEKHASVLKTLKTNIMGLQKSLNFKTFGEIGKVLKYFYEIYDNKEYNDAFLYSFGFNGYIDVLDNFKKHIENKSVNITEFTKNKEKTILFNSYYAVLYDKKPVRNNVKLNKNLIVTGPNASGKTTVIKSTLINIIFSQQFGYGFFEKAKIYPYKYIHCYLNIPDTSGRDSLFQAEARRCKDIIDCISTNNKDRHFCVFDELYSGTNPYEATVGGYAMMNYLSKIKNVNCLLTTHYIKLCEKLRKNDNIKNYNMKTIQLPNGDFEYTYIMSPGISNKKGGFKVLEDMNYPREIIQEIKGSF